MQRDALRRRRMHSCRRGLAPRSKKRTCPSASSLLLATCLYHRRRKKPTWWNASRSSTTSAYCLTNLPAEPGCPSSSRPTISSADCTLRVGECKRLPTPKPEPDAVRYQAQGHVAPTLSAHQPVAPGRVAGQGNGTL